MTLPRTSDSQIISPRRHGEHRVSQGLNMRLSVSLWLSWTLFRWTHAGSTPVAPAWSKWGFE